MAFQLSSDVLNVLSTKFLPEVTRQFNRRSVLLSLVPKKQGFGTAINWTPQFPRTTDAAAFSEGADLQSGELQFDPSVKASLSWAQYRNAFGLSQQIVAQATSSQGSALEMLDQFKNNILNASSNMASVLNADMYAGTGSSNRIAGLTGAGAIAATGTYASVNRSSYSAWASNVLGNSGTPRALTKALMNQMDKLIFTASGQNGRRIIVCDPAVADKYEGLLDAVSRVIVDNGDLSPSTNAQIGTPREMVPGFTGLNFKGYPIYRDVNCPSGKMFFLDLDAIEVRYLPAVSIGPVAAPESHPTNDGVDNVGVPLSLQSLADLGGGPRFMLYCMLQLVVTRPNSHGLISDITVA